MAGRNRGYGVAMGAAAMAFEGRDCLSVVTGGRILKLRMEASEAGSSLILEDPQERTSAVVLEGTALEVSEAFASVSRQAMPRRRRVRLLSGVAAAVVAAFLLGSFVGANGVSGSAPRAADPQDALVRDLIGRATGGTVATTPVGSPLADLGKGTAVLPTPDFLAVPDELPPLPTVAAAAPGLAAPPPSDTTVAARIPVEPVGVPVPKPAPESVAPAGGEDTSPAPGTALSSAEGLPAEAATEVATASAEKALTAPVAAASPQAADVAGTAEAEPASEDAKDDAAQHDPVVTKEQAQQAVGALMQRGMTTDDALGLLSNLDQLAGDDGKIDPAVLKTLPHEVARILIDSGAVGGEGDAPDGVPYRIIRLPDEVMLRHVGRDGIPNIPHQNSWAATGNSVSLPLPGGGDETVESLESFGLKP